MGNMDYTTKKTMSLISIDNIILSLYSLYFILKPFYFWRSGLPQVADFILLFSLVIFIFHSKLKLTIDKKYYCIIFLGLLFVIWIFLVNCIWILKQQEIDSFLLATLSYTYNYIVFCFVIFLVNKYGGVKLLKVTYISVITSLGLQLLQYFAQGGFTGARHTASFNNPNQLGYYALLMMSFIMLFSSRLNIKLRWLLFGLIGSMTFVFASLSKAAIVSATGLIFIYLFTNSSNKKLKRKILISSIILLFFTVIVYNTTDIIQNNHLINSVERRIEGIGTDTDDSLEGRGYTRITKHPEYWFFGAGEGKNDRFEGLKGMEFHSTLGNIQVSYGIVGSILFLLMIYIALKRDKYHSWYIILFLMTYGLTHNGIRNSLLWILLAFLVTGYSEEIKKEWI